MYTWKAIIWGLVAIAAYSYHAGSLGLAVVFSIIAIWFLWADIKASRQEAAIERLLSSRPVIIVEKQTAMRNAGGKVFDGINRIVLIAFFIFCVFLLVKFVGTLA